MCPYLSIWGEIMQPTGQMGQREQKEQSEGPWQKWGVVIAFGAMLLTYIGTASQLHWFPFSHSHQITLPSHSPSPSGPPSPSVSPSPSFSVSFSPSPSPPAPSEAATFDSATSLGLDSCGCYYQYSIHIEFYGMEGQSPVVDWWTVYSASGLDAGTSGSVTDYSLPYNDDTWTTTVDVKEPAGAVNNGWQWYTEFAVYAPDGTELATYS
jgi:hypothetical protein